MTLSVVAIAAACGDDDAPAIDAATVDAPGAVDASAADAALAADAAGIDAPAPDARPARFHDCEDLPGSLAEWPAGVDRQRVQICFSSVDRVCSFAVNCEFIYDEYNFEYAKVSMWHNADNERTVTTSYGWTLSSASAGELTGGELLAVPEATEVTLGLDADGTAASLTLRYDGPSWTVTELTVE